MSIIIVPTLDDFYAALMCENHHINVFKNGRRIATSGIISGGEWIIGNGSEEGLISSRKEIIDGITFISQELKIIPANIKSDTECAFYKRIWTIEETKYKTDEKMEEFLYIWKPTT